MLVYQLGAKLGLDHSFSGRHLPLGGGTKSPIDVQSTRLCKNNNTITETLCRSNSDGSSRRGGNRDEARGSH